MKGYEVFSTTADVGITIRGETFRQLYLNAAEGFYLLVMGEKADQRKEEDAPGLLPFDYLGDSCENVLVNLLSELIFLLYTRNRITPKLMVKKAGEFVLQADLVTYPLQQDPRVEIKSVTYHNLKIREHQSIKSAAIIFDI
ncbi:MAG: archease [Candidatus Aminicenantes bacterium]|nr:archease [Candidatus Aminicenantes bacterium]